MVGLEVVAGVAVGAVPGRREQLAERGRVGRRLVGDDLDQVTRVVLMAPFEEAAGGPGVRLGHEHIDDLADLVDRPVDIAWQPTTLT